MNFLQKIEDFLNKYKPKSVGIITHVNSDPDAVASCAALSLLLSKFFKIEDIEVVFPQGPSKISKRLLEEFYCLSFSEECITKICDVYFVVDTQFFQQLENCEEVIFQKPSFIIDHHEPIEQVVKKACGYIIERETAASVLVYQLILEAGIDLPLGVLHLLAAGIVYDSRRFVHSTSRTFKVFYELLENGVNYDKVLEFLKSEAEIPERIARLKAAKRASIFKSEKWILALSRVGSFEASAARALIDLGADVAIVGNEDDGYIRISARASSKFLRETKVNLASDLMMQLDKVAEGVGGGHKMAAGFNGKGDLELVFQFIKKKLEALLGEKFKPVS